MYIGYTLTITHTIISAVNVFETDSSVAYSVNDRVRLTRKRQGKSDTLQRGRMNVAKFQV